MAGVGSVHSLGILAHVVVVEGALDETLCAHPQLATAESSSSHPQRPPHLEVAGLDVFVQVHAQQLKGDAQVAPAQGSRAPVVAIQLLPISCSKGRAQAYP